MSNKDWKDECADNVNELIDEILPLMSVNFSDENQVSVALAMIAIASSLLIENIIGYSQSDRLYVRDRDGVSYMMTCAANAAIGEMDKILQSHKSN